jgi:hypothetical protein
MRGPAGPSSLVADSARVKRGAAAVDESDTDPIAVGLSQDEDEVIQRATSERIAGRETDGHVDALPRVTAEANRAAGDRLPR